MTGKSNKNIFINNKIKQLANEYEREGKAINLNLVRKMRSFWEVEWEIKQSIE